MCPKAPSPSSLEVVRQRPSGHPVGGHGGRPAGWEVAELGPWFFSGTLQTLLVDVPSQKVTLGNMCDFDAFQMRGHSAHTPARVASWLQESFLAFRHPPACAPAPDFGQQREAEKEGESRGKVTEAGVRGRAWKVETDPWVSLCLVSTQWPGVPSRVRPRFSFSAGIGLCPR